MKTKLPIFLLLAISSAFANINNYISTNSGTESYKLLDQKFSDYDRLKDNYFFVNKVSPYSLINLNKITFKEDKAYAELYKITETNSLDGITYDKKTLYFLEQLSKFTGISSGEPNALDKTLFVLYVPKINQTVVKDAGGWDIFNYKDSLVEKAKELSEKLGDEYNFIYVPIISGDILTNNKAIIDLAFAKNYQSYAIKFDTVTLYKKYNPLYIQKDGEQLVNSLIMNRVLLNDLELEENTIVKYSEKHKSILPLNIFDLINNMDDVAKVIKEN